MILSLLISILTLVILIMFGHKLSKRGTQDLTAIQSAHHKNTNRIGGLSIIVGISSICFVNSWLEVSVLLLISGLPIFIGGFLEDVTGKVSPKFRLLGAAISAILAVLVLGVYIQPGDFWILNSLFAFSIIAIPVTVLISSGIANSFNIIDGIHGFSAGLAFIIACLLGYTCGIYGEPDLQYFCYILAISCVPFLIVNFPFGIIFLGDAGAYTLGHLLFWVAILLLNRHPEISSWAMLLMFYWPATETLLSIYRRFMSKKPSGAPDSFHMHQLILQLFKLSFDKTSKMNQWANPLSTLVLLPLAVVPIIFGLFVIQANFSALIVYIILLVAYFLFYIFLLRKVKKIALSSGKIEIFNKLNHVFTPIQK